MPTTLAEAVPAVEGMTERLRHYAGASRSRRTAEHYARDWAAFVAWCRAHGCRPLPATPIDVANHLVDYAEGVRGSEERRPHAVSTVNRRKCAIAKFHYLAGIGIDDPHARPADPTKHPLLQIIWLGLRNIFGAPPRRKRALAVADLGRALDATDKGMRGARDRALLLLGFHGAFRRSELVGIDVANVAWESGGLVVLLPRSKTDQAGAGRDVAIASVPGSDPRRCPRAALEAWLAAARIDDGPVFRPVLGKGVVVDARLGERSVALRVKALLTVAGVTPTDASRLAYAAHSLRAGFVTEAWRAGADAAAIMDVTGHLSFDTLRRYIRESERWRNPANARIVVPPPIEAA